MVKKMQKKQEKILLSEGIVLSGDFCEQHEKRWTDYIVRTLFLSAIIIGSLGGMLSAFNISYERWAFFIAAFLSALYCASLYFSVWWENVGYVLIFIFVLNAGFGLQTYISSGFYGILNDISASATTFFESSAQISYAEQIENHSLAVSVAMCYFALIGCIFINGLISRKMKYFPVTVFSALFLMVPIYLEQEPKGGYCLLLAAGIVTVYILRQNQYLSHDQKAKAYRKAAKKHLFSGSFSGRAALGALLAITLLCSIVIGITGLIIPKNSYMSENNRSAFKLQTMDTMENFYLLGVMGLINFYPTTGGLVNGRLGGVNSVRLDYETDLTLEFVPYTYDRIYLKTFVGAEYVPFENHWSIQDETAYAEGWDDDTAQRLEQAFLAGKDGSARGIMNIRNAAAMTGVYLPYYSKDTEKLIRPGAEQEYVFYPLLADHLDGSARQPISDLWLEIPEQNQKVIADFCEEAGLSGSAQEIIDQLRTYFQAEFPYTLSPGVTPRRKDFVNYFLTEKRKGYCAHYASSATLILRYMGIPARYVEGYAVDAMEIAEDGELTDRDASLYYEGTSLLFDNTSSEGSVISYDASDGNAHAWVEIYDENLGWYPVELTPYQTEEDESQDSLWEMFLKLFQDGEEDTSANEETQGGTGIIANAIRTTAYGFATCFVLLLLLLPVSLLVKKCVWLYRYHHADRSEKLLMQYRNRLYKIRVRNSHNKELAKKKNFEEQVSWLAGNNILTQDASSQESLIQTLNKAAFSQREISSEAYDHAMNFLSGLH